MKNRTMPSVIVGAVSMLLVGGQMAWGATAKEEDVKKVTAALPDKAQARPARARKLLIYTRANGFVHSSIPLAAETLRLMGEKTGAYTGTISDDPAIFDANNLNQFDAVAMVSTTMDIFVPKDVPEDQKAATKQLGDQRENNLMQFVSGGKGWIGIHAASDTGASRPKYIDLVGGFFDGHPWHEKVGIRVEDKTSPVTQNFNGQDFEIVDEIYQFQGYSRDKQRIQLALDMNKTAKKDGMKRKDNDYAVSWIKSYGQGRVYYCSLGHREDIFWNPQVLKYYLNGIQFALGDLKADTTSLPKPFQTAAGLTQTSATTAGTSGTTGGASNAGGTGAASTGAGAGLPADPVDNLMGEYYAGPETTRWTYRESNKAAVIGEGDGTYRVAVMLPVSPASNEIRRIELTGTADANGTLNTTGRAGDTNWTGSLVNGRLTVTEEGKPPMIFHKVSRRSPTEGMKPPANAIVLLPYAPNQATTLTEWKNKEWRTYPDGSMGVNKGDTTTVREFGDMHLHLEFRVPYEPKGRGQGRGNSGLGFNERYEIQVLDSFGLKQGGGDVGSIYNITAPSANPALPPLAWQTYDIIFRQARMGADGSVQQKPRITVYLNGVKVQDNKEIPSGTGIGSRDHSARGALKLQDHGNPVRYRNIWAVELPANDNTAEQHLQTMIETAARNANALNVNTSMAGDGSNANTPGATSGNTVVLPGDVPIAGSSSRGGRRGNTTPGGAFRPMGLGADTGGAGWKTLFNGQDLTGWKAKDDKVQIRDGAILIPSGAGDIWTNERYGDYILDLEFKNEKGSNSGVMIRTDNPPDWYSGIEIQILDSYGKEQVGKHDVAAIYDCLAPSKNTVKAPGEWNRFIITCKGSNIKVALNGEQVIDADLNQWTEARKNPDGTPNKFNKAYKDMPREGAILLQGHGQPIWFRNIKIRELK